ncbi:MAG: MG2 domain-containing protein [Flavobacteriales bacterium]|nr:MG2 domain-containing protein [Flavobacteriales bacterium]
MRRLIIATLSVISISTGLFTLASGTTSQQGDDPKYLKNWQKVDSLERKGLYRMALSEVEQIFDKATKQENHNQVIKAVLYELRYNAYLEEDDYVLGISRLDELIKKAPSPSKEILHSLTAEVYWGYYSSNSWKFQDRTEVADVDLKDIRTWDLKRIARRIQYHYLLSLNNANISKTAEISDFSDIASYSNQSNDLRPTLFDFLAHRALDFYKSNTFYIQGPAETFVMEEAHYFSSNSTFLSMKPATKDSLSNQFASVKLFQELTRFHLDNKNQDALLILELERLKYVYQNAFHSEKDNLYYTALQRLTNNYHQTPYISEVWYEIAAYHVQKGDLYSAAGDTTNRWEKKVALDICNKTIAKYPNAHGGQQCAALRATILTKELNINGEEAVPTQTRSKFLLQYRNVDQLYMKIIPFDHKKIYKASYNWDKFIMDLRRTKGIHNSTLNLTDPGDYQPHTTEILIPELKNGHYYVIVSSDPEFKDGNTAFSFMPLWVSDITYQSRDIKGKHQVLVSDRESGKPLAGAKATVTYRKYNYRSRMDENKMVGTYTTDKNGRFNFNASEDYKTYNISIQHDGQIYAPASGIYSYPYYDYNNNHYSTQFFTDRTIYRPGQTIYFKGIVVNHSDNKKILATNYSTTVYFYDVNGQEVDHVTVKTNQFGSFEGKFTAPFGVLTGQMCIKNSHGSSCFRVEEYKRPKFMVEMKPLEGEFQLNDQITTTGFAEAFAGNRIDGADVQYRIVRNTTYSPWYYWWYWQPSAPKEIAHGTTQTDENGEFEISFKALADKSVDPKNLPVFSYTIYADVTDINGETHSTSTNVMIGYHSLQLGNNLTSEMNLQDDFFLRLSTTNLNGESIPANGEISIHQLQVPNQVYYDRLWAKPDMPQWKEEKFKELFPLETYHDENIYYNWEKGEEVFSTHFDTKKTDSIAFPKYSSWGPGVYVYEAVSKDKSGVEVKDQFYFTLFNPEAKKAPTNDPLWIKLLKFKVEVGETAEILVGTADEDILVHYDVEVQNTIIKSNQITLSKEQKKLSFPVTESQRGNFTIHFTAIKNNRKFGNSVTVMVPYTNKELDLEFSTFRDKLLPGADEEWTLTIKNKKGEKEMAELLAALYDASLDELYSPNSFYLNVYNTYYGNSQWGNPLGIQQTYGSNIHYYWNDYVGYPYRYFPTLNYFGYSHYYYPGSYNFNYLRGLDGDVMYEQEAVSKKEYSKDKVAEAAELDQTAVDDYDMQGGILDLVDSEISMNTATTSTLESRDDNKQQAVSGNVQNETTGSPEMIDLSTVKARSNFSETAFFFPQLLSDENGNVKIKFTIPESLTKWKFLGLAHTQDLKIGTISEEVVTQKDLMVVPNAPRFLREGDQITISSKVSNLTEEELKGKIQLSLIDPFTEEVIDAKFKLKDFQQDFSVEGKKSTVVSWNIAVPYEVSAVKYRIVAKAGDFSDGEENVLPILSNRMMVTESLPLPIRGKESKAFSFDKLKASGSSATLRHHRYTLEFTSNPAWYALQAMPYMMEYPYECAEQTFTRYYSNAIASHIMNSNPKIKKVIEDWGENSPEAFLSNLEKNQELKSVILEETPWVLDAQDETQSKKNLAILLDMERMSRELDKALAKTIKNQSPNGGWPWFPGMRENRYITQHIITGMGHLDHLGIKDVKENHKVWKMVKKGVQYLDGEIVKDYRNIKKYDPDYKINQHIGYTQIQYLYARSYFPQIGMNKNTQEAVMYFKDQASKFWLNFNIYAEGMIALAAHRMEMKELSTDIVKSLKDRAIHKEEFGMYWKEYYVGYYWYEAPIETQALMIEMFDEVTNDQEAVEELKIWLLKEKQTTNWKTTKQTTEAVYALLLKGTDLLANDDLVEITVGGKAIEYVENPQENNPYQVKSQAGTGYFKTHWNKEEVKPEMGDIQLTKKSEGVAWGAAYWQYFEDLDKITFAETNLKLEKRLFLVDVTDEGEKLRAVEDNQTLEVGDKVRVRIVLRTDRNLEYVHMKDMRASGFEPIDVLSSYRYQDGLGYYQATKDAATNFFFDFIKKGTYVFEYDLRVQHKGNFSNGITTIQCMYAPEFTAHSEGIRVNVK